LASQEVAAYVEHRLAVAGGRKRLFSEAAVRRVAKLSRGVPRLINVLCDRSLLGAYVEEKDQVDLRIVNQAAREVLGRPVTGAGFRAMMRGVSFNGVVLGLLLLILAILAVSFYYGHWQVVSRADESYGISVQELIQLPADKNEVAPEEESVPVVPKQEEREHGSGQEEKKNKTPESTDMGW
jgi:hypothetical protein